MIEIRQVTTKDIHAINQIYTYYIEQTTVTAACDEVTEIETLHQLQLIINQEFPYFVATTAEGDVLGYAYAEPFSERQAYCFVATLSIYLAPDVTGQGIGSQLLSAVESALKQQKIRHLLGLVSGDNEESLSFHQKHGFREIGCFPEAMYKFERWIDLVWVLKELV